MQKLYLSSSAILIFVLCSCIDTAYYYNCPGNRIIGNLYLMDPPEFIIPEKDTLEYYSQDDTLILVSEGLITIDSVLELTPYCEKKKLFGYDKAYESVNTKAYQKHFFNSKRGISIDYRCAILNYWARTSDEPWTENKTEQDTILYDDLIIEYFDKKKIVWGKMRLATSLRTNPDVPYILDDDIHFDSVFVDKYKFTDIYINNGALENNTCTHQNDSINSEELCLMIYKKGKGIIAMKFFSGWYFLKGEE